MNPISSTSYLSNPSIYFAGARKSFVEMLPVHEQGKLLEIGCGNGDTSAYARSQSKCGWCAGVELCEGPAKEAATKMDTVLVGDVEMLTLPYPEKYFDCLLMSEVIEHLRDPWGTLLRLRPYLKPGAWLVAGSPNVAHHTVLRMLLGGRWDYASEGIMDRTHLRWFTPRTYRELFEGCGFNVVFSGPADPLGIKARWVNRLTLGKLEHLLCRQICVLAQVGTSRA